MIGMDPDVTLKGKMGKVSRFITGGELVSSEFMGPGQIILAPPFLGDIAYIKVSGEDKLEWKVGRDAFLACTAMVEKIDSRQALSKALFSGETLWVYKIKGNGLLWISSFGAIIKKDVSHPSIISVTQPHNCDSSSRVSNSSSTTAT